MAITQHVTLCHLCVMNI